MSAAELHFVNLDRPHIFKSSLASAEFAAWIVAEDPILSRDEMEKIADDLVGSGCRYAICSGYDCSAWDDAIDNAHVRQQLDGAIKEDHVVMTTWHPRESIEEIADFFARHATFGAFVPRHYLIIAIGGGPQAFAAFAAMQMHLDCRMTH